MNKYIYFQDGHISGLNPSSRIDNFYQSWILKFREVLSLAKKHKVDAIVKAAQARLCAGIKNGTIQVNYCSLTDPWASLCTPPKTVQVLTTNSSGPGG